MSQAVNEAIELIKVTDDEISRLIDQISDNFSEEDDPLRAHKLYVIASYLNVFASNLSGEQKVYEGPITVNNARACISIEGFEVRGNVQFELMEGVTWVKGHRENSQYGQIFRPNSGGDLVILTSEHRGRVTLPLVMDRVELW